MKVLIAGGFGFIGGRLGELLLQNGHEVLLGSRFIRTVSGVLSQASVVQTDWYSEKSLDHICKEVDVIVHASGMNAEECFDDPVEALEVNKGYVEKLMRSAVRQSVKKYIYLSTAHVYSAPLAGNITEHTPTSNSHPYATSHLAGENIVIKATNDNEIDGTILRLSNAFGMPINKSVNSWMLLVNDLCKQVVINKIMRLRSDGKQYRDFITLTDLCEAIMFFINIDEKNKESIIFNVGSGQAVTVYAMALLVAKRYKKLFGYYPKITKLEDGKMKKDGELFYSINKLIAMGFILSADVVNEIDNLLIFCEKNFNK